MEEFVSLSHNGGQKSVASLVRSAIRLVLILLAAPPLILLAGLSHTASSTLIPPAMQANERLQYSHSQALKYQEVFKTRDIVQN